MTDTPKPDLGAWLYLILIDGLETDAHDNASDTMAAVTEWMRGDPASRVAIALLTYTPGFDDPFSVEDVTDGIFKGIYSYWDMDYPIPEWLDPDGSRERGRLEEIRSAEADLRTEMAMRHVY